jgi:hypothetical protein
MKKIILMFGFVFVLFGFNNVYAFVPLSLVSYDVSETSISPDGDGIKDAVNIDIEYSEQVKSDINIIDSNGNKIRDIYNSNSVTNPQNKIWDGKDNLGQIVSNGVYTIEIIGVATEDITNTLSDTSKTILVDNPIQIHLDVTSPIITLIGDLIINLKVGDVYIDVGATALDDVDLDITSLIAIGGTYVDTSVAGNYTITYDVKDNAGNSAVQIIRTINIEEVTNGGGNGGNNNSNFTTEKYIEVPDNCSIIDTNGNTHLFPKEDSISKFLGICALSEMKKQGGIDDFDIIEYPFGLFIDSINNIKDPNTAYWALYLNDVYENRGLTDLPLVSGDKISLVYVDFNNTEMGSRVDIHISGLLSSENQNVEEKVSHSGGSSIRNNKDFSLENYISFLSSAQKDDGSFGEYLYTDWVAVGIAPLGSEADSLKTKIINYFKNKPLVSELVTDNERHAMALMALGINPYSGTEINYIKKILDSFDGEQFGDKDLVNDDIFAIITLLKAGYTKDDEIIKKDIDFIIGKQDISGSWGSVDMTSAGIIALANFVDINQVADVISKGEVYLKNSQDKDGGFENTFSTSWAIQALSLNTLYKDEVKNGIKYLVNNQKEDGGFDGGDANTRIWASAYAMPVILGKNWNTILVDFKKPETLKDALKIEEIKDKVIEIKKTEEIKEVLNSEEEIVVDEIPAGNNLGASVGNIVKENISINKIVDNVFGNISNIFVYIGKGFYNILVLLGSKIVNIF